MLIRLLNPADAAGFRAVRLRGLTEEPAAFASSYEEECGRPLEATQAQLAPKADGAVFGAFEGDTLLGVVGLQRESMRKLAHKGVVWGMYVVPQGRGRGIARRLLAAALDHAWTQWQLAQVNLSAQTGNQAAVALYRSLGFEVFGTERGSMRVGDRVHDEHHMVCRAPAALTKE
ncbi:GNAT family N-acetyltransferase [Ideonella sp. 4Y16]|uniref:GNAT family N-acetyltransferase n=1 Tax=Ideonella alba TaxID=2824118 RepID=UPI001B38A706|nr:GNAT family N-acetyltransferase [Ideonella alba]MBQ0945150.1 GNAT family N-acetyltransferase [Ideonella alba]